RPPELYTLSLHDALPISSRAEYRLMLREDNADLRLTETGRRLGIVDDVRWDAFNRKRDAIGREQERLKSTWVNPKSLPAELAVRVLGKPIEREYSLMDLLKRPGVGYASLAELCERGALVGDEAVASQVEIQAKYQGYVERQHEEIARQERYETMAMPRNTDYRRVSRR